MVNSTEQRINHILSYSPVVIYTCRADGSFGTTYVSANISFLYGYSVEECFENPNFWKNNIHPDDCERVLATAGLIFENDHSAHEYRFRKKNGEYVWVLDELRLFRDSEGHPVEIIGSWLDITERKELEFSRQQSETLFRDFFQINPVPTIITSPDGVVHMVNPAFAKYTDFSPEEVVGRTSQELGFWRNPEEREHLVATIKRQGYVDNFESSFYGKDNKSLVCVVSSRAIKFEHEIKILSVVIDVTEQRKAEKFLKTLDQAKSDFISTAAHELRTPLIAIVGYSELLENAAKLPLNEEQKDSYLSVIQTNAEILNRLVDDLLDVGRIQVGKTLGVVPRECDLSSLLDNVVKSIKLTTQQHDIFVTHKNKLPETLYLDASRITQVLNNLLNNAVKYSPLGGSVEIQTLTSTDNVSITVCDQGQGMSPQQVDRIFDRFYRSETRNNENSGLGLGLSITKQIVEDHGGEISVASVLGEGSQITFTLKNLP